MFKGKELNQNRLMQGVKVIIKPLSLKNVRHLPSLKIGENLYGLVCLLNTYFVMMTGHIK